MPAYTMIFRRETDDPDMITRWKVTDATTQEAYTSDAMVKREEIVSWVNERLLECKEVRIMFVGKE